jgi:hypothetical protein
MLLRPRCALWLVIFALGGCSLPAPYETYPPASPPPTPPRASNALTVTGATTTTYENELGAGTPATQPPAATQPAPPAASSPSAQQVAICYNRIWNSAEAVRSAAVQACGAKSAPRIVSQEMDLNACPLLTPTHAVFACSAAP